MTRRVKSGRNRRGRSLARHRRALLAPLVCMAAVATAQSPHEADWSPPRAVDATATNEHVWRPHVRSVSVFKNGFGFFTREAKVRLSDGWCVADAVPPATFGTLAIYPLEESQHVDVIGYGPGERIEFNGRDRADTANERRRQLARMVQLRAHVRFLHAGTARELSGRVVSVNDEYLILEAEFGNLAIPLESVRAAQVLDYPMRVHVADAPPDGVTRLGMAYLQRGVTWIPEYTLEILDDSNARLSLRGLFVNDAEDLVRCQLRLVVGVPNFLHTDYLTPLAVGRHLRTLGAAVAPREVMSQIQSRASLSFDNNDQSGQFIRGASFDDTLNRIPQLGGAAANDFTVYVIDNLTVRTGERAVLSLFSETVSYEREYTWRVGESVRHFLRLRNTTDSAWTTGPFLAVSDGQPLSQGLLEYTPRGGLGQISVTSAINLVHQARESEVARKVQAQTLARDTSLDRVDIEGELRLRNFESFPASIEVTAPTAGRPTSASDGGELRSDPDRLRLTERSGEVRWTVVVPPGEERKLTYRYERYVTTQ